MQQPAFCSLSDLLDRCDVFSEPLLGNLCSRSVCRHLFQCCLNFITQPGITFFEANAIFFCCDHIIQESSAGQAGTGFDFQCDLPAFAFDFFYALRSHPLPRTPDP